MELFAHNFDGMMPHGYCLLWQPVLVYLHVIGNAVVALAYFSIPFAIAYFVRHRHDIQFKTLHWQFAAFILFCGLTHLMNIVILWWPWYWLQAAAMTAAALVSLVAAVLVWRLMPTLLQLPSNLQQQQINARLQGEIAEKAAITQRLHEAIQKSEQISQEKSAFLSSVSHEIRTPMNGIIGIAELLADTHLDQEQQSYVYTIQRSAHTLLGLINDILDFSKIEANKLSLEHIAFDPGAVAENCMSIMAPRAYEKKLSLVSVIAPGVPQRLLGDPTRVSQIVLNLLNNAVKFTQAGEVVLRVEASSDADGLAAGQVALLFSVTDTGIGIAAEQIGRLFKPFSQADVSTSRLYGGTGLGLSICKRLSELMGGAIGLSSREGVGSTFWVKIPFSGVDAEIAEPTAIPHLPQHVYLVGHGETLDQAVSGYLQQWGCKVSHCGVQEMAPEYLSAIKGRPFLLLLEKHNASALLKLAKQAKALSGMDVAMVLAVPDDEIAGEARLGGVHVQVQPLTRQSLAGLFAPLAASCPVEAQPDAAPLSVSEALYSGNLILIAEDNPVNQMVAVNLLKKLGHSAHVVSNGQEAVEAVTHLDYGLIFMDCQMPVMDGYEATAAIRQWEVSHGRHIPIIAMTANAMEGDRESCLVVGMDDYVSKPVNAAAIKEVLDRWLSKGATVLPNISDSVPVLDWSRLHDYFDDEAEIRDALQMFVDSLPERITALQPALQQQNVEQLSMLLSNFIASCESFGALRLAELLHLIRRETESLGFNTLNIADPKLWDALVQQMERLEKERHALSALLEQPSSKVI